MADPRIEHRLRSPKIPLVVQAKDFTPDADESSSVFTMDDSPTDSPERNTDVGRSDSPTPTVRLATLLEQEHKINRLQAQELNDAHETIVKLKREAQANQEPGSPRRNHHRKTTSHEIVRLVAENNDLSESLSDARKGLGLKDRQILELESQLHDMSDRLHSALQSLKSAHKGDESYLVPDSEFNPLAATVNSFKNMSMVELGEANMALSHYLAKSRARISPSTPHLTSYISSHVSPKRPASPFPNLRPQSIHAGMKKKEYGAGSGAEEPEYPPPPPSRASQRHTNDDSPNGSHKLTAKKSVRYKSGVPDEEKNGKRGKGLFGMSGFFFRR